MKIPKAYKDLLKICKSLYDDANDRGETHGDDGKEFWDWMELREAIEKCDEANS